MIKVMVVDDEPLARSRLERLLGEIRDVELVGSAANGAEALDQCRKLHPDLVLLDVEMPEVSGLVVAEKLSGLDPAPAVIFTTAFENYAVEAFAVRALDYLVKPVRAERLEEALDRVRTRAAENAEPPVSLSARIGDRLVLIPMDEIRLLLAEDKYTCVHHLKGSALVEDSLVTLEEKYPDHFLRVHRNALVSRSHVQELFRTPDGAYCVRIAHCRLTPEVSRRNLAGLRRFLTRPRG